MNYKKMSEIIKNTRLKMGFTQKELAKNAGTNIRTIIILENSNFGRVKLRTVLKVLNVLWLKLKIVNKEDGD